MKIVEYKIDNEKEIYVIESGKGAILEHVLEFIKEKSNSQSCTKDITKIYCEYLRLYLELLSRQSHNIHTATLDDLDIFKQEISDCCKLSNIDQRCKENLVKRPLDVDEALCTIFSFQSFISNVKMKCYYFEIKKY